MTEEGGVAGDFYGRSENLNSSLFKKRAKFVLTGDNLNRTGQLVPELCLTLGVKMCMCVCVCVRTAVCMCVLVR